MTTLAGRPLPRRLRLAVFDLDGTLVDSSADLTTGLNRMLGQLSPGCLPLSHAKVRTLIGNGARVLVTRALAEAGLERAVDEALPVFLQAYAACLLDQTRFYPGALEALDQLPPVKLAVLTNKPGDLSRELLGGLGAVERFFRVIGGGDSPRKPDPGGLLSLLQEAGAAPEEAILVGDSAIDVRTGRAASVFTVGVDCGFDPEGFASDPPDLRLPDLASLIAALSGVPR